MTALTRSTLVSPLGDLLALWQDDTLLAFTLARSGAERCAAATREAPAPRWLREPLEAYFAGDVRAVDAIPCAAPGTPFQRAVWSLLRTIPAGETRSYGELARHLDRPQAARAVGAANGANPIFLIVPCHRVIDASGKLTGYAHGLACKQWLLDHERAHARDEVTHAI